MRHRDGETDPGQAEVLRDIRELLRKHGATEEEIARAEREDFLDLLVADRLLLPSSVRYDEAEVAEITGMPVELSRRFWRALGFPDPRPDEKMFTDLDIEAIRNLESMVEIGVGDVETFLQLARVVGASMSRIADAEVSPAMLGIFATPAGDSVAAADRFARVADQMLPATARLLEFVWRRHVQAAIRRAMTLRERGQAESLPLLCIGFADMVGFTVLSQQLSDEELAAVVSRFEDVAHDVVTARGGRVVKMIGDEVMFVTESLLAAANIGLALAETYADDELLSDVRVALALGRVLVQDGDYYGPVVNLANRVVDIAAPGSVLVTDDFHTGLLDELQRSGEDDRGSGSDGGFAFSPLRLRVIRDVGRIQLWSLYRPGSEPNRLDRRAGRRWERLGEVLRELDDLRDRGEKMLSGGLRAAAHLEPGAPSALGTPKGSDSERTQRKGPVESSEGPSS